MRLVAVVDFHDPPPQGEPAPDPSAEFRGRHAGERQAEHRARLDQLIGHQPQDARGHGFGLARAGTGNDDRRQLRRFDDGGLFGCRLGRPKQRRQLAGGLTPYSGIFCPQPILFQYFATIHPYQSSASE